MAVIRLWDHGKTVSGSFDSEAQLKEVMGRYYRHVPELRAKGWLDDLDVHDWGDDQANPDSTAAERQRRRRAKLNSTPADVTPLRHGLSRRDTNPTNTPRHGVTVTPVTAPVTGIARALTETETETLTETGLPRTPRTTPQEPKRARDSGPDNSDPDDAPPAPPSSPDVDPDDIPMAIPQIQLLAMDSWLVEHTYPALVGLDRGAAGRFLAQHTGLTAADFIKTWDDAHAGNVRMRSVLGIAFEKPGGGQRTRVELRMERRLERENQARHERTRDAEKASVPARGAGEMTSGHEAARALVEGMRASGAIGPEA